MPEIPDSVKYLVPLFFELGMCKSGMSGALPIDWSDIAAWKEVTGRKVEGWECMLLRDMSLAYVSELSAAKDKRKTPPYMSRLGLGLNRLLVNYDSKKAFGSEIEDD